VSEQRFGFGAERAGVARDLRVDAGGGVGLRLIEARRATTLKTIGNRGLP
jgi:hypothetical protein